jgi:membrane protease YdiL (CAAX protease family)
VPWNGAPALLAVAFVTLAILAALFSGGRAGSRSADADTPRDAVRDIALNLAEQGMLVGAVLAMVVVIAGARRVDLGLPESVGGLVRDVKLGVVAWLAALVPVYGTQLALVLWFGQPSEHPLIKMVSKDPSGSIFAAAFFAAVVFAPVCEEIAFRLLLQGWLEKWEDGRLGSRGDLRREGNAVDTVSETAPDLAVNDEALISNEEHLACADGSVAARQPLATEAPERGLLGLPHGWAPILASSVMFALAHLGVGPDPIPLFLLALVLGYTYQRTHRIVPCMVTHALFNSLTLLALWRMLSSGEAVPQ